jgi:enhanced filamentous growth protein 1
MINGTKLLNVAGMTRGRRDGILKSEKVRHVVKIGPMHLKGVWIPFDRALDFANKEKITESLYPLFVHDIGALLYHPSNPNQPRPGVGAAGALSAMDRRRNDGRYMTGPQTPQGPSLHHHSMSTPIAGAPPPQPQSANRPSLDRAHTFPTPPASASSVMGPMQGSYEPWSGSNVQGAHPLSIDTGLSNTRSVPTTPASTPPGKPIHGTTYYPTSESYHAPRPVYSAPAGQQPQYQPQQQMRFGGPLQSANYPKTEMAPPTKAGRFKNLLADVFGIN